VANGKTMKSTGTASRKTAQFPIVGLGCSAGGLEACAEFLGGLSADAGMALVVVSHLDPDHKGIFASAASAFSLCSEPLPPRRDRLLRV
jgi:chemotaxis response regulator CheB